MRHTSFELNALFFKNEVQLDFLDQAQFNAPIDVNFRTFFKKALKKATQGTNVVQNVWPAAVGVTQLARHSMGVSRIRSGSDTWSHARQVRGCGSEKAYDWGRQGRGVCSGSK